MKERGYKVQNDQQFQLKTMQLELLDELVRVFRELDISYVCAYGTLLGAMRHQGYIPWDDDIDVMIFGKDYLKLEEQIEGVLGEDYYYQSHLHNVHNMISWCRIGKKNTTSISKKYLSNQGEWGVCLDIFPLFYTPDPASAGYKKKLAQAKELIRLCNKYSYHLDYQNGSPVRKLYSKLQAREGDEANLLKARFLYQELYGDESVDHTHLVDIAELSCAYAQEDILPEGSVIFEGRSLSAPRNADKVLTSFYGDWRTPPAPDQRQNHTQHDDMILDFTKPWTAYVRGDEG